MGVASCKKTEIGPQCPTCIEEDIAIKYDDVLIGCEGNFGWGNASISLFNPTNNSITNTVFQNINGYASGRCVAVYHRIQWPFICSGKQLWQNRSFGYCYVSKNSYYQVV